MERLLFWMFNLLFEQRKCLFSVQFWLCAGWNILLLEFDPLFAIDDLLGLV
jgi:hypothetical protein